MTHYADRDHAELDRDGNYYCRHVAAMTKEGLHAKSDIAAELAWRDREIDRLRRTPQPVTPAGGAVEPVAYCDPTDPRNRDAFAWPGSAREDRHTTALYLHPPAADAALVRDAERYRFLRLAEMSDGYLQPGQWKLVTQDRGKGTILYGADLDRAVDAALNQRGGGA